MAGVNGAARDVDASIAEVLKRAVLGEGDAANDGHADDLVGRLPPAVWTPVPLKASAGEPCNLVDVDGVEGARWWSYQSERVSLRIAQAPETGLGGRVWEVSLLFARVLEHLLSTMPRCRVLELGAGCGLVGGVLARLGHDVVLTDTPAMQPLLRANVASACDLVPGDHKAEVASADQRTTVSARAEVLAWGDLSDAENIAASGPFDLVVGADVTYLSHVRVSVLKTLSWLCGPSTLVLLAHATREDQTPLSIVEAFRDMFEPARWLADSEVMDPPDLGSKKRRATVLAFRPRQEVYAQLSGAPSARARHTGLCSDLDEDEAGAVYSGSGGDRDESCTCCGGPISAELHGRRGICSPCLDEPF
mmetsp:Transcript_70184/g.195293  ORF Transcript_70184/g.195293 Transcript_70184/m.195293 type:complete len:363 (-) Transcript_70184:88-1176(-)